jgi:hypothetical protein
MRLLACLCIKVLVCVCACVCSTLCCDAVAFSQLSVVAQSRAPASEIMCTE